MSIVRCIMKAFVLSLLCVLGVALGRGMEALRVELQQGAPVRPRANQSEELAAGAPRYHERAGVPLAAMLQASERQPQGPGVAPRIVGGLGSYVGEHPFFVSALVRFGSINSINSSFLELL